MKERTAFIVRVTVMVEMDAEVIRRKQMCLLLRAMKNSSLKVTLKQFSTLVIS
jgi:hypothetical protein